MCLALFRFQPDEDWPFLLVSIRDEDLARPAQGAGRWWPEAHPDVIGGRDLQGGGTWLAVDPGRRTVAAVFTPGGPTSDSSGGRSRGELPLAALGVGGIDSLDLRAYLPFTLLVAGTNGATWWSWDRSQLERTPVAPGFHVANIVGLDAVARSPRQARWLPRFTETTPVPFDASGDVRSRWRRWLDLLDDGLEEGRLDSLLIRHTGPRGAYGTKSVALLALGKQDLRYDVTERPGDARSWTSVATG